MTSTQRCANGSARAWPSVAAAIALMTFGCGAVQAAETDPAVILKQMVDYVDGQKTISFAFDSDIEVVTPNLMKLQFASSGKVLLSRPDKFKVTRTGGYSDIEFVFDGKTASLLGKNIKAYAQLDAPGTSAQLIDRIRSETPLGLPGADLLVGNEDMVADAYEALMIGYGVVDGADCYHLAFRTTDVDWQIWIDAGAKPIPRKYVITTKATTAAPQYSIRIYDWKTDPTVAADTFDFKAPADAKKVNLAELSALDEVPEGTFMGGKK